jgi:hypothetical protein
VHIQVVLLHPDILANFDLVQVSQKDPQGCLQHGILGAMPFSLPHILVADLQYGPGMGCEWESVPASRESQYDPEMGYDWESVPASRSVVIMVS